MYNSKKNKSLKNAQKSHMYCIFLKTSYVMYKNRRKRRHVSIEKNTHAHKIANHDSPYKYIFKIHIVENTELPQKKQWFPEKKRQRYRGTKK